MEQTIVEAHNCQTKKPNSKTPYTTSTDQHKSTKKRVSTKPKLIIKSKGATGFTI